MKKLKIHVFRISTFWHWPHDSILSVIVTIQVWRRFSRIRIYEVTYCVQKSNLTPVKPISSSSGSGTSDSDSDSSSSSDSKDSKDSKLKSGKLEAFGSEIEDQKFTVKFFSGRNRKFVTILEKRPSDADRKTLSALSSGL